MSVLVIKQLYIKDDKVIIDNSSKDISFELKDKLTHLPTQLIYLIWKNEMIIFFIIIKKNLFTREVC